LKIVFTPKSILMRRVRASKFCFLKEKQAKPRWAYRVFLPVLKSKKSGGAALTTPPLLNARFFRVLN
jgi:hypothetical protein